MKKKAKSDRISWIDIARGICIIAIVIGHTLKNSWLRTYALSFDVPMFFFLSGYCYRYPTNKLNYIWKKVRTIVTPYVFFSIVSIFAFGLASKLIPRVNDIMDCSILNNLLVMIYGNSKPDIMKYNSPLWFLPCFFVTSVFACFLESIIRKIDKCEILRSGAILLLILSGGVFLPKDLYFRGTLKRQYLCSYGMN